VGTGGATLPAGSGGAPSSAGGTPIFGAGGAPLPYGGYDSTISFDWPEVAATAGACKAGRYSGKFDGLYLAPVAPIPVPIAGDVNLVLEQSQDGEFFTVADGNISGLVYGIIPFSSGLQGTLNCKTGRLEGGFMPNGKYNFLGVDYPYEGPIDANYDKLTSAFVNGTWAVGEPTYQRGGPRPVNGGEGTWGASWVGP
jgi:hypothetical protein